jgi:8-oxo-dGTP pyrophosphatase MutT (NUDIX family)
MDTPVEPTPAATVVVARDGDEGLTVLMVRRNSAHAFGGMWVFPGGRVDRADAVDAIESCGELAAARRAAVRECREEAGLDVDAADLVPLSHWVPPPQAPRRFATWFFLVAAPAEATVTIDGHEIHDHEWIRPADAIERNDRGEIEIVPPPWITLATLAPFATAADALAHAAAHDPAYFATRLAIDGDVRVTVWEGDAAYDDGDLSHPGPRRRLSMRPGQWQYEGKLP